MSDIFDRLYLSEGLLNTHRAIFFLFFKKERIRLTFEYCIIQFLHDVLYTVQYNIVQHGCVHFLIISSILGSL